MAIWPTNLNFNVSAWIRSKRCRRLLKQPLRLNTHSQAALFPLEAPVRGADYRVGGVFTRCGQFITKSGLVRQSQQLIQPITDPVYDNCTYMPGRAIYLGACFNHYGHFITESLGRIWPLIQEGIDSYDHIVVLPWTTIPLYALKVFQQMGLSDRLLIPETPIIFETLDVPDTLITLGDQVHSSITCLSQIYADVDKIRGIEEQVLFISRANVGLSGFDRALIGEEAIENMLENSGARIFRPEEHELEEQIRILKSHRTVVGFGGSGLHTLLLSGGKKSIFGYTARKLPPIFPLIDAALENNSVYVHAKGKLLPGMAPLRTCFMPQIINPKPVLSVLKSSGLISDFDLSELSSPDYLNAITQKYNTVLLLRHAVETRAKAELNVTRIAIDQFVDKFKIDWQHVQEQATRNTDLTEIFGSYLD